MKYKILLYLIFILKYPINENDFDKLEKFHENDLKFCKNCFAKRSQECQEIESNLKFSTNLKNSLNVLFGVRRSQYAQYWNSSIQTNIQIVVKYLGNNDIFKKIKSELCPDENCSDFGDNSTAISKLTSLFSNESRFEGCQLCPASSTQSFFQILKTHNPHASDLLIWIYLNVNAQPMLLPMLHRQRFPVPKVLATCEFVMFQTYAGEPLIQFTKAEFRLKLLIAKQLLEAAQIFTKGYQAFRFYLTDITLDNIVFDQTTRKISFIDLDNVIIVDSSKAQLGIHKHNQIECYGCFAYVPEDICAKTKSDLNLFAVCQFLREDLLGNHQMGFLQPIPRDFFELTALLDYCVDCPHDCENRFEIADEVLIEIEKILHFE